MTIPGNLLFTEDKKQIKVADFGLAREEIMDEMTCEAGTYRWMAPEVLVFFSFSKLCLSQISLFLSNSNYYVKQLFSKEALKVGMKKHYDRKVDVYSFAIVFWQLLTNEIPFKGRDGITVGYATAANVCFSNSPQQKIICIISASSLPCHCFPKTCFHDFSNFHRKLRFHVHFLLEFFP